MRRHLVSPVGKVGAEPLDHLRVDVGAVNLDVVGERTEVAHESPAAAAEIQQPIKVRKRSGNADALIAEPGPLLEANGGTAASAFSNRRRLLNPSASNECRAAVTSLPSNDGTTRSIKSAGGTGVRFSSSDNTGRR